MFASPTLTHRFPCTRWGRMTESMLHYSSLSILQIPASPCFFLLPRFPPSLILSNSRPIFRLSLSPRPSFPASVFPFLPAFSHVLLSFHLSPTHSVTHTRTFPLSPSLSSTAHRPAAPNGPQFSPSLVIPPWFPIPIIQSLH